MKTDESGKDTLHRQLIDSTAHNCLTRGQGGALSGENAARLGEPKCRPFVFNNKLGSFGEITFFGKPKLAEAAALRVGLGLGSFGNRTASDHLAALCACHWAVPGLSGGSWYCFHRVRGENFGGTVVNGKWRFWRRARGYVFYTYNIVDGG